MSNSPRLEIDGLKRFERTLGTAAEGLDRFDIPARAAAVMASSRAKAIAPRGATGRLIGSIGYHLSRRRNAVITAGGPSAPHAVYVYQGVPKYGRPARPFLIDAAQGTETAWLAAYQQHVDLDIKKVHGK